MPPPRRRRPVQPATRVRLPRSARSQPAAEAKPPAGRSGQDADLRAGVSGEPGAGSTSARAEDAPPAGTLTQAEQADAGPAAGETVTDETTGERGGETTAAGGDFADGDFADDDLADGGFEEDTEVEPAAGVEPAGQPVARGERRHPLFLPACLGGVAVILGGLAAWFGLAAGNAGSGVNTQNIALINPAATRQVNQAIDAAVNTIFSYNYADVAKTQRAAQHLLTGQAIRQYNQLFKLVAHNAPQEKLVLTTTVTNSGVELLEGNLARLLIFINQSDTSNAVHKTTAAGSMFSVTAVRQGGQWKISSIDTFAGG